MKLVFVSSYQISMMEPFAVIFNGFYPLLFSQKCATRNAWKEPNLYSISLEQAIFLRYKTKFAFVPITRTFNSHSISFFRVDIFKFIFSFK